MLSANTNVEAVKRELLLIRPKLLMEDAMEHAQIINSLIQRVITLHVLNAQLVMIWKTSTYEIFMVNVKNAQHTLIQINHKLNASPVSQVLGKSSYQLDSVKPAQIIQFLTHQAYSVWMLIAQNQDKKFSQMEHVKPAQTTPPHFGMKLPQHGHVSPVEENLLDQMKLFKLMELAAIAVSKKAYLVLAKMVNMASVT